MAWLLFLDESGHDHKQMPYEVRGGVAIQDSLNCGRSRGRFSNWSENASVVVCMNSKRN